jgi:HSP20 family protein
LSLGEGIDASAIYATYENGVLTVTIPLAERAKPRKIDVAHGGEQRSIDTHTTIEAE